MSLRDSPGTVPPIARPSVGKSNPWAIVSLVCAVAPILLLYLYHPIIIGALMNLFPDNYLGAAMDFLAVPLLLTLVALASGIAANIRAAHLPPRSARFGLSVSALSLSFLDVALFFIAWLPTVNEAHSMPLMR
ncbi:MAG: hypothetical protein ACRDHP_09675 [Ktedonobacterales bacterium]